MREPTHADEERDAIWAYVRSRGGEFTLNDVACQVRLHTSTIRDYLAGLTAAGYLRAERTQTGGRFAATTYRLVRDCGIDAPKVRRDGTPCTMGRGREQMWNAMTVLRDFAPRDLAFAASTEEYPVSETDAKHYCRYLYRAGYLAMTRRSIPGRQARYRLVPGRWTGPRPPQVQRHQLYDPNLKRIVWSETEESP